MLNFTGNMQEYIDLLKTLVGIPSVSGGEKEAADALQSFMEAKGLRPRRIANNVWAESEPAAAGSARTAPESPETTQAADKTEPTGTPATAEKATGPTRPCILLNAHIDTVKPAPGWTKEPFKAVQEEDRIYGLGTNDDGASLVCLLAAYADLIKEPLPYRLVFSATAGEENCAPDGIEIALPEFGRIDFGIIGEPTGMRLAVAERGLMVLDCVSRGVSGHAAREEGVNAIYEAMKDIEWMRTYRFAKESAYLGPVKMSVTMIQAGVQHNVVPAECRFVCDVRPNGEYSNEQILQTIRENVSAEVTPRSMKHQSSAIAPNHPFVQRATELGIPLFGSPTTSNQTRCSFPTVKIGPGDSARSHTADEYVRISEIEQAVAIYKSLLRR